MDVRYLQDKLSEIEGIGDLLIESFSHESLSLQTLVSFTLTPVLSFVISGRLATFFSVPPRLDSKSLKSKVNLVDCGANYTICSFESSK